MTSQRRALVVLFAVGVGVAPVSCIEVGREAEVGCFVDPTEPGCPGGGVRDAGDGGSGDPRSGDAGSGSRGDADATLEAGHDAAPDGVADGDAAVSD